MKSFELFICLVVLVANLLIFITTALNGNMTISLFLLHGVVSIVTMFISRPTGKREIMTELEYNKLTGELIKYSEVYHNEDSE